MSASGILDTVQSLRQKTWESEYIPESTILVVPLTDYENFEVVELFRAETIEELEVSLTDGSVEVPYLPSPGADAIVIDLGKECTVTAVIHERISDNSSPDVSSLTDESVLNVEIAPLVKPSPLIEVAGSDREFYPFAAESRISTDAVRYVRIHGASGLREVSVYGERESVNTVSSVAITRSVEDEGWMFAIPVVEYSEEALVNIYDVSGRMVWSGHCESGSVLHWDGITGNGTTVSNGVYLLQCSIGSEVSTGSFVVRRN